MSRRRNFDTGLSGSNRAPKPSSKPAPAPKLPASITPPDADTAILHVPTHESGDPASNKAKGKTDTPPPELDDSTTCFICAEPVTYWAVGQCNHPVCHVCAIRLRVFYKMIECAYCKTLCPSLLFSRSADATFPDGPFRHPSSQRAIERAQAAADKPENKGKKWYTGLILPGTLELNDLPHTDEKLGVVFEDEEVMEASLLLLRFNCPYPDCAHMANGWQALEKHTLAEHGLVFCKICTRQLSRFSHEQILYPPHLLPLHDPSRLSRGQKPPRPRTDKERDMIKTWDSPHPVCEFCHEAFFGPDELFKHMREKHEECFVCKQSGNPHVYFQNYAKLEAHFNRDHYPCQNPACIEKKFQIFGSELDLRAHMMEEHGQQMSQRDRAQARQVHMDFRPESSTAARGGRGFSLATGPPANGMREAAPQAQQLAPPPMNAAQAEQHRRQVQTDRQEESRRRRQFATGLTEASGAGVGAGAGGSRGGRSNPASGRNSPDQAPGSGFATPRDDIDDATAARHAALLSRVSMLVNDSQNKLASFRSAVRQFKNNESSAQDMINSIWVTLDEDAEATSGVVREIANLFDGDGEQDKQRAILEGLNTFKIHQQEQFPALGGPSGIGSDWAGVSSGRILSAKRATHTGRGVAGSRTVWSRVEAAAANHPANRPTTGLNGRYVPGSGASAESAFPSLGSSGSGSGTSRHSTSWAAGGAGSSSRTPSALVPQIRSVNYSVPTPRARQANPAAFPALPSSAAAKQAAAERAALFSKPTARDESLARIKGIPPRGSAVPKNQWSAGSSRNASSASLADDAAAEMGHLSVQDEDAQAQGQAQQQGKKKKGKGKQLLFSVSARP